MKPLFHSRIPLLSLFWAATSFFLPFVATAEKNDSINYKVEIHATLSSGENTPFWLVSNLQGLGSPEKNNGFVRAAAFKDIDHAARFSWGAGIDLVGAWRSPSSFYIHQLFGEIKYRSLGAFIGSKEIWGDFNNPRLSSGGLLYSGNSLPIPQVRLGIFDYADVWRCNGWFAVKGYIAYGFFSDSKWQKHWVAPDETYNQDVLYHSKGLWMRGGNTDVFPLQGELGVEMATQFGGKAIKGDKVIDMKPTLADWFKAFFPIREKVVNFMGETASVSGNMIGQYTMALSWLPEADWSIRTYYEHIFEDHSQMTFEYGWKDGLWGIDVTLPKNPFVSEFVYEYLYSKDQTGAVNNDTSENVPEQVSGRDNYYNHSVYSGWQHWGLGIGNPLIISPLYNNNHLLKLLDTRIKAHHFAIAGSPTDEINYRLLFSFSKSWGTYDYPRPEVFSNFNALAEVSFHPRRLNGWYASASFACDGGSLLGRSVGGAVTIGKSGGFLINKKRKL